MTTHDETVTTHDETVTGHDETVTTPEAFTDSPVVTTTVRLLAPFVLTYGLFTLFHGTTSVGGGFQGGVVAAATVVTLAFALGVRQTTDWLSDRALWGLAAAGPVVFAVVALAGVAAGGAFLQFDLLPIPKPSVYATEAVEVGIGATVAAVVVVLFTRMTADYAEPTDDTPPTDGAASTDDTDPTDGAASTDDTDPTDGAASTDDTDPTDDPTADDGGVSR